MQYSLLLLIFSVSATLSFQIEKVQHAFVSQLYEEVLKENAENMFVCPLALQFNFAGLSVGAEESTSEEIKNVMNLIPDEEERQEEFNEIGSNLRFNKSITLYCIKDIYYDQDISINGAYADRMKNYYHTNLLAYNFNTPDYTSNKINSIIRNATNEIIQNLTDAKDFNNKLNLVIINAISFHGKWLKTFNLRRGQFVTKDNANVETDMLSTIDYFHYKNSEKLQAEFLNIKYADSNLSLTIVKPSGDNSLSKMEKNIVSFLDTNFDYPYDKISVSIPKLKIESNFQLNPIFQSIGIKNAFDSNSAKFNKISEDSGVHIGSVIQRVVVEINEVGASDIDSKFTCDNNCKKFVANRPFLFYIKLFDIVVFIGRYVTPS